MGDRYSFGLLKPHYTLAPDRVTIARNVWLPPLLLAAGAPGAYFLTQAFSHRHLDGSMFGAGFVCIMVALFALVMTPWLVPGRIIVTRDGVTWGSKRCPREAVVAVRAISNQIRSGHGSYLSWTVVLVLRGGQPLVLSLGNRNAGASTDPLMALGRGLKAALG